jgi:tetratricopeptide (TPR) repeat protein
MQGLGKTAVALKYAHTSSRRYPYRFWSNAANSGDLESGYLKIAQLTGWDQAQAQDPSKIIETVKDALSKRDDWLLVLDNVANLEMASKYFPEKNKGHLLLTTSLPDTDQVHPIELKLMDCDHGAELLLKRAGREPPNEAEFRVAREICSQLLGGLPLAIYQAGAYLKETRAPLPKFKKSFKDIFDNLDKPQDGPRRHLAIVRTTFKLSFECIESSNNRAAAELLRFCSFLDGDGVPEELFEVSADKLGFAISDFDSVLALIQQYSLIQRDPQKEALIIHRLVQRVIQTEMDEETRHLWAQNAVKAVDNAFPAAAFPLATDKDWKGCQTYITQAQACARIDEIDKNALRFEEAGGLMNRAAFYLHLRGEYAEAEPLYDLAEGICRDLTLPRSRLADILNRRGRLKNTLGQYQEAIKLFQKALDIRTAEFGPSHRDVADSLDGLALVYANQGNDAVAQDNFREAYKIRKSQSTLDDPAALEGLNNLASFYCARGRFEEAKPLLQEAESIGKSAPNGPDYARTIHIQSVLQLADGQFEESKKLAEKALKIREKVWGPEHPDVADSLAHLAILFYTQGKYRDSETHGKRALDIREKKLGLEHPLVAASRNNLGDVYVKLRRYKKAEDHLLKALKIRKKALRPEHPDVAHTNNSLALLYLVQANAGVATASEEYAKARPYCEEALRIRKVEFPEDHLDVLQSMNNVADVYSHIGEHDEAAKLYKSVLAVREKKLGDKHPDVAQTLNSLALLYHRQGSFEQAETEFLRARKIYSEMLPPDHPLVAGVHYNLGDLYSDWPKKEQAKSSFLDALKIYEGAVNPDKVSIEDVRHKLANL